MSAENDSTVPVVAEIPSALALVKRGSPRSTAIGLSLSGAFLLTALISLFLILKIYADNNTWIAHTYQVISRSRESLNVLLDVETGVRGYVASKQELFLEPYRQSSDKVDALIDELKTLTADNAPEQARFENLKQLYKKQMLILRGLMDTVSSGKADSAEVNKLLLQGKENMDLCRKLINDVEAAEKELLATRQRQSEQTQMFLISSLVVATIVAIFSMLFVLTFFRRYLAESQAFAIALETTAEELRMSNVELQQFAYVASHDLQEPLRAVAGFLRLISKKYKGQLDDQADKWIDFAVDGAQRMQVLINDLLELSRVDTRGGQLQRVETADAVETAQKNLAETIAETDAVIEVGNLPPVNGDLNQLVQLFQNLLGNAIKFRSESQPRITISGTVDGKFCNFAVKDNGIGFDMEHADRIFLIFQRLQTRNKYPGTGIGLAICKKIIDRHGGRIWAESAPGSGTTFNFTLPSAK